ncbi:hypothetical protein R1flu_007616 [Riccia fluitans]|uniref:Large ribosomal subunit protein mL45 n=1 Tax=Riccia fluitans TaxID=41844 RepID=A0ABD1YZD5_9MARC
MARMPRFQVKDVWSAICRLSRRQGESSWASTRLPHTTSGDVATVLSPSKVYGAHAESNLPQRGLACVTKWARTDSVRRKVVGVDVTDLSTSVGTYTPLIISSGAFTSCRDHQYWPSGLGVLLDSSSGIAEKPFMCCSNQPGIRGYAKTVQVPQAMQKPMKLKLYMGSPGVIGEPYKPPPPPLPFIRRWFTKEGWARRKQSFMGMIKTSYTIAKLRQKTKGYSQQKFYQEVSDLYKQINSALAEGERTKLRHLVTDSVFSIMKNELKHRENSTWAKVDWEMVGPVTKLRTVQGRLIGVDKNNHDNAFVQLTVRINSKQKFAAYDKRGKLAAGDPEKELLVEDIWVFEKPLLLTEAKWRLCARLSV